MTSAIQDLAIDAHVHLYPAYDWRVAARSLAENLGRISGDRTIRLGLLAEGAGFGFFREARSVPGRYRDADLALEPCGDACALRIREGQQILGYLIAGRQIVTRERLEVLALGADADIADGAPVKDVLERVRDAGAVPVLCWSPGKWFFERGRVVRALLESPASGRFLLGDTALRPKGWGYPALLALGRRRGFKVLAGSDPLPLAGEERRIGRYGVRVRAEFDPEAPAESVRRMLFYGNVFLETAGARLCPLQFAWRWVANWKRKAARGG